VPSIGGGLAPTLSLHGLVDVIGMAEERRRITRELIDRWRAALTGAATMNGGVLLYGPPSAGKRFFVRVAAGECALPIAEIDLAAASDPWGEPDPAALASQFAAARRSGPMVVLLANVEAATHRRLRYTATGRRVLTELLAGIDSVQGTNVFVVATSSAPWLVQPVVRMPGRLLHAVLIGPPDRLARQHLILGSLRRRGVASDIDVEAAAEAMQGYTTDDIEAALDAAVARAYADSTKLGRVTRVQHAHLRTVLVDAPRRADAWFDSAYNFPEFTDDSAQFDPLFDYIRRHVRRS
jgi:SpoVK/Ycf46/Vps4 family AAA+-type ATPase